MSDEPSFEEVMAGMEGAMGDQPGTSPGDGPQGQAQGSSKQASSGQPGGASGQGQGQYGSYPGSSGSGNGGNGSGPLTPAEQVAILDAQLERGTGEFDAMILEEQTAQREAARNSTAQQPPVDASRPGSGGQGNSEYGAGGVASSGGYGGGIGGATGGGGQMPKNTAKYPPPEDIPSGDGDDVVARQLREAAMREPDPAVREKLWDEYRKYKGISK